VLQVESDTGGKVPVKINFKGTPKSQEEPPLGLPKGLLVNKLNLN